MSNTTIIWKVHFFNCRKDGRTSISNLQPYSKYVYDFDDTLNGILFCNHPIQSENPRLLDIAPTVLGLFGVPAPEYMDGQALVVGESEKTPSKGKTPEIQVA